MSSYAEMKVREAMEFARAGDLRQAQRELRYLGEGVSTDTSENIRKEVSLEYLRHCKIPIVFGIVEAHDFRIFTTIAGEYIGLSPFAFSCFRVDNPTYTKGGDNQEVLFELENRLYYANFTKRTYAGIVMEANGGTLWVAPFFALNKILDIARMHMHDTKEKDRHVWDLPKNFKISSKEHVDIRPKHTNLALSYYGLPFKENDDE